MRLGFGVFSFLSLLHFSFSLSLTKTIPTLSLSAWLSLVCIGLLQFTGSIYHQIPDLIVTCIQLQEIYVFLFRQNSGLTYGVYYLSYICLTLDKNSLNISFVNKFYMFISYYVPDYICLVIYNTTTFKTAYISHSAFEFDS